MTLDQDSTWKSETAIPDYKKGTMIYFKVVAIGENDDTTETDAEDEGFPVHEYDQEK